MMLNFLNTLILLMRMNCDMLFRINIILFLNIFEHFL
jgi:hypothetical protein